MKEICVLMREMEGTHVFLRVMEEISFSLDYP